MLLFVAILWGMLFLLTPAFLIRIYSLSNSHILRLLTSLAAHLFISLITGIILLFLVVGADPRPNHETPSIVKFICFIMVLFYAVSGWMLGWFVNKKPISSLDFINLGKEKPQSVFMHE